MYREDEFYQILDKLRFDMYHATLKNKKDTILQRVILKKFTKDDEVIFVETINGIDNIIKDNRVDKSTDLLTYDLSELALIERITSSIELENRVYEYINNVGAWSRVKIKDYSPCNKDLQIFFTNNRENLNEYQEEFKKIVKEEQFNSTEEMKNILNTLF